MVTNHIECVEPVRLNKYYISKSYGGYSNCQVKSMRDGWVLPNCVGFAAGWYNYERNKLLGKPEGTFLDGMNYQAANFWWQATNEKGKLYKKVKTGQVPKEGAIACFDGGTKDKDGDYCGHVFIVDKVIDDNTIMIAEGSASGVTFHKEKATNTNGRWGMNSSFKFQGFIYNDGVKEIIMPEPTQKSKTKNQLYISKETLRVREEPNLNGKILGLAKIGYYDYTDTEVNDNYIWYKIGDKCWCAGVKGTSTDFPVMKIGDVVMVNPDANIRIAFKPFAYSTFWRIEKIYPNTDRVLLRNISNNKVMNTKASNVTPA